MSRIALVVLLLLTVAVFGLLAVSMSAPEPQPAIAQTEQTPKPGAKSPEAPDAALDEKTPEIETPDVHPPAPSAEDRLPPMPGATPSPSSSSAASEPGQPPLPEPVQRMREAIMDAARTGDIDRMQAVLEMSELKPMTGSGPGEKAIDFWRRTSADGAGRALLAAMLNVFDTNCARVDGKGGPDMYIWPGFSERPLTTITPVEEVELYRIVPADKADPMKKAGKYQSYRGAIGADGTWHYFVIPK